MEKTFSRNDLYDEVWTTPLTRLGKKYGLSDNGVRKICRAMNIPLPKAGHWAKVAAGQVIPRTPLSDDAKRASVVSRPPEENPFRVPEDDDWLRAKSAEEESADSRISVDLKPARWHAAIAPLPFMPRNGLRGWPSRSVEVRDSGEAEAIRLANRFDRRQAWIYALAVL